MKSNVKNNCYTCKPRGTLKEHIISQTEDFTFNHDMFRRPLIVITSKQHYHTLYEMPDEEAKENYIDSIDEYNRIKKNKKVYV